jgi:hypothetical protein
VRAACVLFVLALASAGCDPTWGYRLAPGQPEHVRAGDLELLAVSGEVVTGSLNVSLNVRNAGGAPVRFEPKPLRVRDAHGTELPVYSGFPELNLRGTGQPVTLGVGQVCHLEGEFLVEPRGLPFGRNRALRTLTIVADGLASLGSPPAEAVLRWK